MTASPAKTGAAGAVTAAVVTVIAAVVKHYNIDIPADAQVSLAVGIVTAAHWIGEQYARRKSQPATLKAMPVAAPAAVAPAQPATPAQ
jgi:hypothetical protein